MALAGRILAIALTGWLALTVARVALTAEVHLDESEALASAALLEAGLAPGRDFFQKQPELAWQALRPLVRAAPDDATALLWARLVMLGLVLLDLLALYSLARALAPGRRWIALVTVVAFACATPFFREALVVRADGFMLPFLMAGLTFSTWHLRRPGPFLALAAGLSLGLACAFLPKAAPYALALAMLGTWLAWRGQGATWTHLGLAGLGALLPMAGLAAWLAWQGRLADYWFFVVVFNSELYAHPPLIDQPWAWYLQRWVVVTLTEGAAWLPPLVAAALGLLLVGLARARRWAEDHDRRPLLPTLAMLAASLAVLGLNQLPQL
jgi:hypothetical protein